jgi:hypothetical protein
MEHQMEWEREKEREREREREWEYMQDARMHVESTERRQGRVGGEREGPGSKWDWIITGFATP